MQLSKITAQPKYKYQTNKIKVKKKLGKNVKSAMLSMKTVLPTML